jgi:peptidoglycan hydrolase CwlO-like protein
LTFPPRHTKLLIKSGGYYYDRGKKMKKNHLFTVAITIFIVFGILATIKKIQSVEEQSDYAEGRISDLESQVQNAEGRISDLESQVQDLEYRAR